MSVWAYATDARGKAQVTKATKATKFSEARGEGG